MSKQIKCPECNCTNFKCPQYTWNEQDFRVLSDGTLDWGMSDNFDYENEKAVGVGYADCEHMRVLKTQIPINPHNSEVYKAWCRKMADISSVYFDASFRAVDVERGFFQLIQSGKVAVCGQNRIPKYRLIRDVERDYSSRLALMVSMLWTVSLPFELFADNELMECLRKRKGRWSFFQ